MAFCYLFPGGVVPISISMLIQFDKSSIKKKQFICVYFGQCIFYSHIRSSFYLLFKSHSTDKQFEIHFNALIIEMLYLSLWLFYVFPLVSFSISSFTSVSNFGLSIISFNLWNWRKDIILSCHGNSVPFCMYATAVSVCIGRCVRACIEWTIYYWLVNKR